MTSLNYHQSLRSYCDHRVKSQGAMDKQLAGLSILLTLAWVAVVTAVMWSIYK